MTAVSNTPRKIEYGYKAYQTPRRALFLVEKKDGKYSLPNGWEREHEEVVVIGETDIWYVYEIQEFSYGEWIGKKVVQKNCLLPIGIHKTRLVKWLDGQLILFDDMQLCR